MTTTLNALQSETGVWSCPDSQLILPVTASRSEWLAARRGGIGGSDLGALMGVSPYSNPYQVWESKTGDPVDIMTKRMRRGLRFESAIAEEFAEEHGLAIKRVGLHRSRQYPHLMGSVDRACDDGGGVEIKWVQNYYTAKKLLKSFESDDPDQEDLFPPHWLWQVLLYLAVTGRTHWWLAAMLPGIDDLYVRRFDAIEYSEQIARIGPAIEAWWQIHIDGGIIPSEGAPYVPGDLKGGKVVEAFDPQRVLASAARMKLLKEEGAAGELEIKDIQAYAKHELGDAEVLAVNGNHVFKWNPRAGANRFLRKEFKAAHPALEAEFSKQGEPTGFVSLAK